MNRDQALSRIDKYFQTGEFETELNQRIAFKTESNLPNCDDALKSYLEKNLSPYLQELGFTCIIHSNPCAGAGPFLVAHRSEGEELPTVMTYGHGDVVAGYDDKRDDKISPWKITKSGKRSYGRGAADNKGQHTVNLASLVV